MATVCWICWRENLGRKLSYVLVDLGRQGAGDAALVGRLFQHIFSVASHTLNHDPRVGQIMIQYGSKTFGMKTGYVESPWEEGFNDFVWHDDRFTRLQYVCKKLLEYSALYTHKQV